MNFLELFLTGEVMPSVITIVEPKEHIVKLWGRQKIQENETYRLMKYILRVNHEGKSLLHNVVTGQLIVLDEYETDALQGLEFRYSYVIDQLILEHFLVPVWYDEHQQVINLRNILCKLADAMKPKEVTSYLILPTTGCNARCWYCFEKDVMPVTMSKETATEVVEFIANHCCGKPVYIWWFGGEPTLADKRIDDICEGLRQKGITYFSDISTNGYLFDVDMINRAKNLWNIRQVTISLDGTEESYNRVKAFQNSNGSPYQIMMENVGLLLKEGIAVALRMNYDQSTYMDFASLLREVKTRFPEKSALMVYPHQINRDYLDKAECESAQKWFNEKNNELRELAHSVGLYRYKSYELPSLSFEMCGAANGRWFVITPLGQLACCGEQLGESQIKGDLQHGVTDFALEHSWKQFADYETCQKCVLFPRCAKMLHCKSNNLCYHKTDYIAMISKVIGDVYNASVKQ